MTGQTVSHYRILDKLGEGGMGVVYKAEDINLDRTVALKFLAPHLLESDEHKQRFLRGAKAAAALDHPNICIVHEVGEVDGRVFLTMGYIDGPEVRTKIRERPLKLDDALDIAIQAAEGLRAAHDKNIVHRDIKSANLMVTSDGRVKLTDFGLAYLVDGTRLTKTNTVAGTPAYMSPEQAQSQPVDRRTDIWSLGVVLYEMVTGRLPFAGEREEGTIYAILHSSPEPITALRVGVPAELDWIVGKALGKNRDLRYQHVDDLLVDLARLRKKLSDPEATPHLPPFPTVTRADAARRRLRFLYVGTLATISIFAAVLALVHFREAPPEQQVLTTTILPPDKATLVETAISPDGKLLAFSSTSEGRRQLWVRSLRALTAEPLAGTDHAEYPFRSPDSRWIGFFANGKLKKVEAAGGPVQTLCDVNTPVGGTWNATGVIGYSALDIGLFRVPAQGDAPIPITATDRTRGEINHGWPVFLPGGRRYIYWVDSSNENTAGIYVGALDSMERTRLVGDQSSPAYAEGTAGEGYLLFVREGALMAQRLDASRGTLTGEAFTVAENVRTLGGGRASFSVSGTGLLVYESGQGRQRQLTWMDRSGKRLETVGEPTAGFLWPALSPDEKQVAFSLHGALGGRKICVRDLARGVTTRFTFDPRSDSIVPVWSPDGSRIVFSANREGKWDLYAKSTMGVGQEELLLKTENRKFASDWSASTGLLLYYELDPKTNFDPWVVPMNGAQSPAAFLRTESNERDGVFSPDGKWIAYSSDESGRYEVYVQPYPATGTKEQVSKEGGRWPKWRRDGNEMYWLDASGAMMAAEASVIPVFRSGNPQRLFPTFEATALSAIGFERYAVSGNGERFLVPMLLEQTESGRPVNVVQNWLAWAKR